MFRIQHTNMNIEITGRLEMNLRDKCASFVDEITNGISHEEVSGLDSLRKNVLELIVDSFNKHVNANTGVLNYIAADSAVVEVVDNETGLCFRRELPLRYEETGNGVSLIGEDISGNDSQISFLSEAAYEKIKDMVGKGPDAPNCDGHGV